MDKDQDATTNIQSLNMLSNKEIFRILSFEYRQPDGLKIETIASLVSKVFYPFEDPDVLRKNFHGDITKAFEPYADQNGKISEDRFCEVMGKIDKYINKDNYSRFVLKIFKRHDSDKDDLLNKESSFCLFFRLHHADEELPRPQSHRKRYQRYLQFDREGLKVRGRH